MAYAFNDDKTKIAINSNPVYAEQTVEVQDGISGTTLTTEVTDITTYVNMMIADGYAPIGIMPLVSDTSSASGQDLARKVVMVVIRKDSIENKWYAVVTAKGTTSGASTFLSIPCLIMYISTNNHILNADN